MPEEAKSEATSERIGRPGDPCVMVIFGASGDLTRRKLIPALYNLGKNHLLSREFRGGGRGPRCHDHRRVSGQAQAGSCSSSPTSKLDAELEDVVSARMYYLTGEFGDSETFQQLKDLLAEDGHRSRDPSELFLLPRHRARFLRPGSRTTQRGRSDDRRESPLAARDRREALWPRPRIRQGPEQATPQRRRRIADLPHRSLPGQRNRPEHHGVPICQRYLRAHLEPALHRSRPDLSGRDGRRRAARRLLRPRRCAARHGSQSHHAAHQPHRYGASHLVSGRRRAR